MAKEQEKEKKDTNKGQAADPKAKKKPGRPAKRKSSAKVKAEADEAPKAGSEQNAPVNEETTPQSNAADTPEPVKPKKRGRPKRKPAKKAATPNEEPQTATTAGDAKETAVPEAEVPKENTTAPKEGAEENIPEAADQPANTEQEVPKATKKSRSRRKSGRKKGGAKNTEQPVKGAQEEAPEPTPEQIETPPEEAVDNEVSASEANVQPAEEVKPRKKKSRKKKSKKKEAAVPPPEEEPAPVIVQDNKVVISSKNPAKIKAVELAYGRMFPGTEFVYDSIAIPSGVSDQPMSDDETFAGALFRAQMAREEVQDAGYYVGLEGGLEEIGEELHAFAWMVVLGQNGVMGKARTSTFVLPYAVAELIRDGKELGEADDIVFGETNSKQGRGAVGILTHGLIDRAQYYSEAMIMALIPFKNPEHYPVETVEKVIV